MANHPAAMAGGTIGYKAALERTSWNVFKKEQLPELLRIPHEEREELFL